MNVNHPVVLSPRRSRAGASLACVLFVALPILSGSVRAHADDSAPLVALDAQDASAGTETWNNAGTLGVFHKVGAPEVRTIGGVRAVFFDGLKDGYAGPESVAALEGASPRTIAVWAYTDGPGGDEGPLVAWGHRGGPNGANMCFGYGLNGAYGAAGHWSDDLGWNGFPEPGQWHYLVYTYDGQKARVYEDTAVKNVRAVALDTPHSHVNIAVQNRANGDLAFINEYTNQPAGSPVAIAQVRVEAGALTAKQIAQDFQADAAKYHATAMLSCYDLLVNSGSPQVVSPSLTLRVSGATQEALSLSPSGTAFDFLPSDRLETRAVDGCYELGDIDFRMRTGTGGWRSFSTAAHHVKLTTATIPGGLSADLGPSLAGCPLAVKRDWVRSGDGIAMRFTLRNTTQSPVELGAFGAAMVHNNILTGRTLEETHEKCAFADPYVGGDAGYLQVTRLSGKGPVLLVLPERGTGFEAYRPLHDDPTPRDVTFEGFYEWTVHSKAYAENEWKKAKGWNGATSRVLKPGESVTYGFRFVLAPSIRGIEPALIARQRPVAVGVPGYVVPMDQNTELFLHAPSAVTGVRVDPSGALKVAPAGKVAGGWTKYAVTGMTPGRCRVTLRYADGTSQFIHYFVTLPASQQTRNLGSFHQTRQWFADKSDPFGRTYSFMPYHESTHELVSQYDPTWMVGLSDEMGAGPNLLMAVKNEAQPDPAQVAQLEQYVDNVLWGKLQGPDDGIRASLFYYDPQALGIPGYYKVHGGWDKARTETTWRSFNYPHQAAVYWSLYRIARNHQGLVTAHPWQWYLEHACRTAMAMGTHAGPPPDGYQQFGQMVGDIYLRILDDCKREGWTQQANALESYEKIRADHFRSLKYPYGSEMPWDSTGQEEVYNVCHYFGYDDKAAQTVDAVLAYDPTVPNWGYNGSARRYFDEAVNGTQWPDIMRELHQYGGGQNAIPLLGAYRDHPDDFYLLRVGYAGTMGALADIAPDGFGSQCFDADPAIMDFDPYVGDYGIEFYGFSVNSGAYVLRHPQFGWLGFGCNVAAHGAKIEIAPCDAFRNRIYIAPLGLFLTLDAGTFQHAVLDTAHRTVTVTLSKSTADTPTALLNVRTPGAGGRTYTLDTYPASSKDRYAIPLRPLPVTFVVKPAR